MRHLTIAVISILNWGLASAQNCFLKKDSVYLFIAQTSNDWGTNGITSSLDSLTLSFDSKASFFCSFHSSLSFTHAFTGSFEDVAKDETELKPYADCVELLKSSKIDYKELKKIRRNYKKYLVTLKDGTTVLVRTIKISGEFLAYERNNSFIPQPHENFDAVCYKTKWSYFYHNVTRQRFSMSEIKTLDSVFKPFDK